MQVNPGSVEALTGVLMDLLTYLKKSGEGRMLQLAAGLDLPLSQLCSLFIIDDCAEPPAVHELAERLHLSVAATGRAVDALTRAGIVVRREDEHDRRIKRVSLAEPGRQIIQRLIETDQEGLRAFAEKLTGEERVGLVKALTPIMAREEFRHKRPMQEGAALQMTTERAHCRRFA